MKKQRGVHFSFVLLLGLSIIQSTVISARAAATNLHSLWKVEGKSCVVYLAGSVHALKAQNYPLPAPFEQAFTNSSIVVFEVDVSQMENPEVQSKMVKKSELPEGETLQTQLSPATYTALSNYVGRIGLPIFAFENFKPSVTCIALEAVELQKLGFDPAHGMDKYFFARAQQAGKQIVPLETVDFQIDLITGFSKAESEMLVKTWLKEMEGMKEKFDQLVKAWETGDVAALEKLLNEVQRQTPTLFKRLVSDRNQRWMTKVEELLRGNKNAMVVVGAGHLVGSDGLVELLRKKGFKVTQF